MHATGTRTTRMRTARMRTAAVRGAACAALLGLALAGCGRETTHPEPGPEQTGGERTDGQQTGAPDADQPARLAGPVTLSVSGGVAGVNDGIEVAPDGAVRVRLGDDASHVAPALAEAELTALATAVARVDFDALPASSIDGQIADMFRYRVEYQGGSVLTDGTEPLGPVDDVISLLTGHLDDRRTPAPSATAD